MPSSDRQAVAQHQKNYAQILQLRQTADALDQQIKDAVTTLAETRKEILDMPFTTFADDSRDVPFNELLQYATNISRYTVPPTSRLKPPPSASETQPIATEATTPAANGGALLSTEGAAAAADGTQKAESRGIGWDSLPEEFRTWLESDSKTVFMPWPKDDNIRGGALSAIQAQLELGEDPDLAPAPGAQEQETQDMAAESDHQSSKVEPAAAERPAEARPRPPPPPPPPSSAPKPKPAADFAGFELYDHPDEA
jgi:hypothetical protein